MSDKEKEVVEKLLEYLRGKDQQMTEKYHGPRRQLFRDYDEGAWDAYLDVLEFLEEML